jgi:hypothetical protein
MVVQAIWVLHKFSQDSLHFDGHRKWCSLSLQISLWFGEAQEVVSYGFRATSIAEAGYVEGTPPRGGAGIDVRTKKEDHSMVIVHILNRIKLSSLLVSCSTLSRFDRLPLLPRRWVHRPHDLPTTLQVKL